MNLMGGSYTLNGNMNKKRKLTKKLNKTRERIVGRSWLEAKEGIG